MRDRLIELWGCAIDFCKSFLCAECEFKNIGYPECMDLRIADYLLANNVIAPPIDVGQKVWYIRGGYYNSAHKKPCEIEVTEINKKWHGKTLDWGFIANGTRYRFTSIGKTVFLTKEEAEAKLKGE